MGKIIKLYNTWRKVKDVFVKPKLKVNFGTLMRNPYAWCRRVYFSLLGNKITRKYAYQVVNSVCIPTKVVKKQRFGDSEIPVTEYLFVTHKLPGKLHHGSWVWKSSFRKKLKRWHLSWLPPFIYLPHFFSFKIINMDVQYKSKFDYISYELPPQFSIIAFGLSLTFSLHCPVQDGFADDDHYWEAILSHLYENSTKTIEELLDICGIWIKYDRNDCRTKYFALRPQFLVPSKQEEYQIAVKKKSLRRKERIL